MIKIRPSISAGIIASALALAGPAIGQTAKDTSATLAGDLVNDLHAAFGDHHARAVHAKGVILEGAFQPTKEAQTLSTAAIFSAEVPVIVRFSDFTGIPTISDTDPLASPRGFAVKFDPAGGSPMDVVAHGFNGFPVATSKEFGQLLLAIAASGPDAPKPTKLDTFLARHPIAKTFLTTQSPAPESYATNAYFGVNSLAFINAKGARTFVRYRFVPRAGEHYLDPAASAAKDPNFLHAEIETRVKAAPIAFDWYAQISGPGDKIDDPSIAWPESRKLVKLGTITISRMAADQKASDQSLLFLPGTVPSGIEIADPMLEVRNQSYPISFGERQ